MTDETRSATIDRDFVDLLATTTSDFAGHRDLVPTGRQGDETMPSGVGRDVADDENDPLTTEFDLEDPQAEEQLPLRRRLGRYLSSISPVGIEGPTMPLLVIGAGSLLGGWSSGALGIAAPEIQAEYGTSIVALTALTAMTSTATMILGIPLGYLVDRVSRVWLVRIGQLSAPIGSLLQATAPSFGLFTAGGLVATVAAIPGDAAGNPLLADYYGSRSRARVYGLLSLCGAIGGLIATPVTGYLIAQLGWRSATLVLSVMGAVIACGSFLLREPRRGAADRVDAGMSQEMAEAPEPPPPTMAEALRGAWAIRTLRLQAIGGFVSGLTAPLSILLSLIMASKFALGPMERALVGTLTSVLTLPAILVGTGVADRLMAKKPSTVVALQAGMAFVSSFVMIGQAFAPNLVVFIALSLIPPIISAVLTPVSFTISSMVVPARYRGVGMQVFTPFAVISTLLSPVMLKVAGQIDLQSAFLMFAPLMLLGGVIMLASAGTVSSDIRAARAAAVAEQETLRASRDHADKVLVCRDVEVTIGEAVLLAGVDLDVRDGEILALSGTNGAGKSTLLRAMCSLTPTSNGAVFYDGVDVTYLPTSDLVTRGMVYVPGGKGVFAALTVRENLQVAANSVEGHTDLQECLGLFPGLSQRLDTRAELLSGGEQQMLALAQAMMLRPRLLMIDEMSLGLAPAVVADLIKAVQAINATGTSVVIVEQSLNIAIQICDRLVYMDQGKVVFDGPGEQILSHPDIVRSTFLGTAASGIRVRARTRMPGQGGDSAPDVMRCEDISLAFGGVQALSDIALTLHAGEVVGLIGANGAGKTTLFDVLSGHRQSDSGRVWLHGEEITGMAPHARARLGLARAFQSARLFGPLTVRENIAVALDRRASGNALSAALWSSKVRASEKALARRVDAYIDLVGLGKFADKFVGELSTGTRRAVEIACQMACEPKMLLLDEPSSGLAQAEVEALGPALARIVRETGCGIAIIEHDLPLLIDVSDRLVAMERGHIIADGPTEQTLSHPAVLAGYLAVADDDGAAAAVVVKRSGADVCGAASTHPSPHRETNPAGNREGDQR